MYKIFILRSLVLLLLMSISSYSQVQSALQLFPLHNGDFWQYYVEYSSGELAQDTSYSYYGYRTVLKDSVLPNGMDYKIIHNHKLAYDELLYEDWDEFVRIDSSTACVYDYVDTSDYKVDSLCLGQNESFVPEYNGYVGSFWPIYCTSVDTVLLFGSQRMGKEMFTSVGIDGGYDEYYKYASGIGKSSRSFMDHSNLANVLDTLVYASINGIDYGTLVDVKTSGKSILTYQLNQNYPNPFNPSTVISYQLPTAGFVTLNIYDVLGREVRTLVNQREHAGNYSVTFDAHHLPSGVYFYRLQAGTYTQTKKLLLLK